jgi:hypothetical protein
MKRLVFVCLFLLPLLTVQGQRLTYEYGYDHAGNRVRRIIVIINRNDNERNQSDETLAPLTDVFGNGETMRLYPNPTTESVTFELTGGGEIGSYFLSDINGRQIAGGTCEGSTLKLDLSKQRDGVYLLELFIDEKPHVYKVIKQ